MRFETLVDVIAYRAANFPERMAFSFIDEQGRQENITYQALYDSAQLIASHLLQKLEPGDRALLLYPPGLDLIKAYCACLIAGVVAVPVYPPVRDDLVDKINHVMDDCQPRMILANRETAQRIRQLKLFRLGLKTPLISGLLKRYMSAVESLSQWDFDGVEWLISDKLSAPVDASFPKIHADTLAFLQYTSGSTGDPKGVEIRHSSALANLAIIEEVAEAKENDVAVFWVPPYHDLGLVAGILSPLYSGAHAYLMSPLSFLRKPFLWLDTISRFKGNLSCAPNFAFDYCRHKISAEEKARLDLSSWRFCLNGAEPIASETIEAFYEAFKSCGLKRECLSPGYGMAESVVAVSSTKASEPYRHKFIDRHALALGKVKTIEADSPDAYNLVSCGRPYQSVLIVDPNSLEEKPSGEIGEVWLRGQSLSRGYWQKEDLNQEVFHAQLAHAKPDKQSAYFRTGDLGFLDEDNDLYITGRLKDMLIVRGRNIYPQDVERSIDQCHPLIRRGCSAVFPDTLDNQEELIACVEVRDAFQQSNTGEILTAIEQAVIESAGVLPYSINLIKAGSSFKTTSGKIQRQKTKQAYLEGRLDLLHQGIRGARTEEYQTLLATFMLASVPEREQILKDRLKQIVASVLFIQNPERIPEDIDLFDFGVDSIRGLEIWHRVNVLLGAPDKLSKDILFEKNSIQALSRFIQQEILSDYFPLTELVSDTQPETPDKKQPESDQSPASQDNLVSVLHENHRQVFLTGATGVLGSYLVKLLLEEADVELHCLIRGNDMPEAYKKLKALLETYHASDRVLQKMESHLHFYHGDIALNNLGLPADLYRQLTARIDCCIHAAANLDLQLAYEELYEVNVFGTKQVIEFCRQTTKPHLLYVSTYAVMGDIQFSAQKPFTEADFDRKQGFSGMGYQRSKFQAEALVRASSDMQWQILRPGNIFGDSQTGAYPLRQKAESMIFYDIFKTFIETQVAVDSALLLDITPVDYVAKAIVHLMSEKGHHGQTFHLTNPRQCSFSEIVDFLVAAGYGLERVSPEEYVKRAHTNQIKRAGQSYRSLTTHMARHKADFICGVEATAPDNTNTRALLETHGIACPAIDQNLLALYMGYCQETGYIA